MVVGGPYMHLVSGTLAPVGCSWVILCVRRKRTIRKQVQKEERDRERERDGVFRVLKNPLALHRVRCERHLYLRLSHENISVAGLIGYHPGERNMTCLSVKHSLHQLAGSWLIHDS